MSRPAIPTEMDASGSVALIAGLIALAIGLTVLLCSCGALS